jgi:hypothetical protein
LAAFKRARLKVMVYSMIKKQVIYMKESLKEVFSMEKE